ncbi:alpha/beta hydrolase-fold protein [Lunatimonas salinarum]|uniref:alpha/beta hydrolase-fold protein n=1 Tax=Lunatimonas salinarum TaxID=1774590 RepID=UPI001ADF3ED1|nr:alpha/beta hydrolase-fold protein [Lunatimonas salinarum]
MRLKICIIILLSGLLSETFAQSIARVENVKIQSKSLNQEREILIYTPNDYDLRVHEYFNVIYVFDAQARELFDYTSSTIPFLTDARKSFIIVGITSPNNENIDYSRLNDFLPPESEAFKNRVANFYGNADNFLNYVETEVVRYVNLKYRTLNHNIAVGHSLGASFILYSLLKRPNLFQNYIAISPNLAYDENKISKELSKFDYTKIQNSTFIYLSNADEGVEYWKEWKPAREKIYSFFRDTLKNENVTVEIAEYTKNNHWNTFPPSLNHALEFYFKNIQEKQENELSKEKFEVVIKVKTFGKDDVIYISGNQPNLGDWSPSKVKMKKISDFEREIVLTVQSPAQFKFTKGSWDTELQVKGAYKNLIIKPETKKDFEFELVKDE